MSKKTRKVKAAMTAKAEKAPSAAKLPTIARGTLEKLVGKQVRYVGRNAKFRGKLVELRAVRTTKLAPCGYDARLALGDSTQYCSVTSIKLA